MCQGQGVPRLDIISGCVCEGVSSPGEPLNWWIQQTALPRVCGHHPGGLKRTKNQSEDSFQSCLSALGRRSSPAVGVGICFTGSPSSQVFGFRLELHEGLSGVSSFQLQMMGLLSLHNHVNQILTVNPLLYIYLQIE